MATFGQGAPGARIRLRDASAVNLVINPNITAGIVGYSSKGEFNKIIDLTSTAEQDTILGNGYNNPKFNQGLYAARAIINAGGFVEYVRPFGEDVIEDDTDPDYDTNQVLKTDTFLVEYDFSGAASSSFDISHYASTRYIQDGIITKGSREIHTIAKTLVEHTNVDFEIDADAQVDAASGTDKVTLFALMNSDPTASNRADVEDTELSGVDYVSVKTVATGKASKKYDYLEIVGGANVILPTNTGDTFDVVNNINSAYTLEFLDVVAGATITSSDNLGVEIVHSTFETDYTSSEDTLTVADGTKFSVGDSITLVEDNTLPTGLAEDTDYLVTAISGNDLTIVANDGSATAVTMTADGTAPNTVVNQTAIVRNISTALASAGYGTNRSSKIAFDGLDVDITNNLIQLGLGEAVKFSVDDSVLYSDKNTIAGVETIGGLTDGTIYKVASVDLANDTIGLKDATTGVAIDITAATASSVTFRLVNLSTSPVSTSVNDGNKGLRLDIVGSFGLEVPEVDQDAATSFVTVGALTYIQVPGDMDYSTSPEKTVGATTDGIVLDDSVGRTFLSLGLAVEDYQDIDFDGDSDRIFTLTAEGEAVARIYLFIDYLFAGESYSFSGTIVPYVFNDLNLDIKEQADNVKNGWEFVINENISLENAILDPNFDLSQSEYNGNIESVFTQVAFNANDPAIINDAIWEYDPRNNNGSAMLAQSWELFLDKDEARADMLVSAGTTINNLFVKNLEQVNYSVMDKILDICEKRKDLFAIFDGVDEVKVDNALKKMVGIGSQGDLSRWGAIFDGRSIFFDSVYTKLNVEAVKSIEVSAIITLNRASNVYWLPPAGYENGRIPAALSRRQKYNRKYNYADDPNSDIARLYDANINPTRVNDQGQFIYGQKTMLKRTTALNRLNVIMLVAGIHKRFADFLDRKVFQLNTPALRNAISAELQAQLELIKASNPAGLTEGICICDDTNNPPKVVDTNQLIVDIFLQPTRTAEFITLRTTVQRTGDTASIVSAQLIGG